MIRIGQGFDVHAFSAEPGRPLRLGGVEIPGGPALEGHSDADVVLHAVVDALLGAAALGDIGTIFGTNDPRWAGADSAAFVTQAVTMVEARGLVVGNLDCTVIAARPRLSGHSARMRERIATLLDIAVDRVSVKATSTDGLGFTGRGEGVACLALATLVPSTDAENERARVAP